MGFLAYKKLAKFNKKKLQDLLLKRTFLKANNICENKEIYLKQVEQLAHKHIKNIYHK